MQFVSNIPYADAVSAKYENLVAYCASQAMREQGIERIAGKIVSVECKFYLPIPESRACKKEHIYPLSPLTQHESGELPVPACKRLHEGEPHGQRPDLDNLLKSLDGLNGVVWSDDCLVYGLEAMKLWSHNPRTEIRIT